MSRMRVNIFLNDGTKSKGKVLIITQGDDLMKILRNGETKLNLPPNSAKYESHMNIFTQYTCI